MMGSMRMGMTKLIAPNLMFLPHRLVHGVKQFHLVAEPVEQTLVDGVPEIGAGPVIRSGETYVYDFVVRQAGTFMYHAHTMDAKQEMMGLAGMIVSLARQPMTHREYVILLQEWAVQTEGGMDMADMQMGRHTTSMTQTTGASPMSDDTWRAGYGRGRFDINPMSMDFNYFTLNGKAYPDTVPLRVRRGERVRIRMGNISMDSHPMHLHGHEFQVIAADGYFSLTARLTRLPCILQ